MGGGGGCHCPEVLSFVGLGPVRVHSMDAACHCGCQVVVCGWWGLFACITYCSSGGPIFEGRWFMDKLVMGWVVVSGCCGAMLCIMCLQLVRSKGTRQARDSRLLLI